MTKRKANDKRNDKRSGQKERQTTQQKPIPMIEYTEGIYNFYVYILTNKNRTVLYTGVTNNLRRRLREHSEKKNATSFTARYHVEFLVYYEHFTWIQLAIAREKEIKDWRRELKDTMILGFNPEWHFLNDHFILP
jgi:putative endonuclease